MRQNDCNTQTRTRLGSSFVCLTLACVLVTCINAQTLDAQTLDAQIRDAQIRDAQIRDAQTREGEAPAEPRAQDRKVQNGFSMYPTGAPKRSLFDFGFGKKKKPARQSVQRTPVSVTPTAVAQPTRKIDPFTKPTFQKPVDPAAMNYPPTQRHSEYRAPSPFDPISNPPVPNNLPPADSFRTIERVPPKMMSNVGPQNQTTSSTVWPSEQFQPTHSTAIPQVASNSLNQGQTPGQQGSKHSFSPQEQQNNNHSNNSVLIAPTKSQTNSSSKIIAQQENSTVWQSETVNNNAIRNQEKIPAIKSSTTKPTRNNPSSTTPKTSSGSSPSANPPGDADPLTQEEQDNILRKLLVDKNAKQKQQLQALERRKALQQQQMLNRLPNYLPAEAYGPNQQSEISPSHWGADPTGIHSGNNCYPQTPYAPCPDDPAVYNRAFDPNPPRKPIQQILYESKKFGMIDLMYLEPRYRENTAITITDGLTQQKISGDFELQLSTRVGFGIETLSGPGVEIFYSELDQTNFVSRTSSATSVLTTTAILAPSTSNRTLSSFAANQTLTVNQSTDLQSFDTMFFKFLKFPVAAIVGHIGIRYTEIDHEQHAELFDGGGIRLQTLDHASDFRGFGPRLGITYIRPIGHTRLRMVGSMHGAVMAGDREHVATDSTGFSFIDSASEQIVSSLEMKLGVEYAYMLTDSTGFYGKLGFEAHQWFNGGTPIDPNSSFGASGLVFGIGLNR